MTDGAPGTIGGMPSGRFFAFVSIGILTAIGSIYLPVLGFDFLEYDDKSYVFGNEDLKDGLTPGAVKAVFTRSYVSSWHPVAMLSHALDISLFGADAGLHHLMNVLFHVTNSLLVLLVWHRLTGRPVESAVLAVFWAIHPQHVEPVAWIASRKDLISTLFFLLCLLAYNRFARGGGLGSYLMVAAALILGLLAKPMLVTVPAVLLLLDFWPLNRLNDRRAIRRCVLEKIPLLLICIAFAGITQTVQTEGGAVRPLSEVPIEARLLNVQVAYGSYVLKAFWPTDLSVFYPHPMNNISWGRFAAGLAILVGGSTLAVIQWRRRPHLFVGWFWFVGTLIPVIGLVQFGSHGMADRYTYVPHLGLLTAVVWGVAELVRTRRRLRALVVVVVMLSVLGAAFQSSRYVMVFRNDVTLFSHVLSVTRPHIVPWINLGYGYQIYGWYDEALDCYAQAMKFKGTPIQLLRNIGASHAERGAPYAAREAFARIVQQYPEDEVARRNVEMMDEQISQVQARLRPLEAALANDSDNEALREQLGYEYVRTGQPKKTIALYETVEQDMPLRLTATVLVEQRRLDDAAAALGVAIAASPNDPELRFALVRVLYRMGRDGEAEALLTQLVLHHPDYADAHRYRRMLGL